jgi:hypothetical protein
MANRMPMILPWRALQIPWGPPWRQQRVVIMVLAAVNAKTPTLLKRPRLQCSGQMTDLLVPEDSQSFLFAHFNL